MRVEAFDILNTILEISSQRVCYSCVTDEPEEAGGRASLVITTEQLELSSSGGAKAALWAQMLCLPYSGRQFPEINSGYDHYIGE